MRTALRRRAQILRRRRSSCVLALTRLKIAEARDGTADAFGNPLKTDVPRSLVLCQVFLVSLIAGGCQERLPTPQGFQGLVEFDARTLSSELRSELVWLSAILCALVTLSSLRFRKNCSEVTPIWNVACIAQKDESS